MSNLLFCIIILEPPPNGHRSIDGGERGWDLVMRRHVSSAGQIGQPNMEVIRFP